MAVSNTESEAAEPSHVPIPKTEPVLQLMNVAIVMAYSVGLLFNAVFVLAIARSKHLRSFGEVWLNLSLSVCDLLLSMVVLSTYGSSLGSDVSMLAKSNVLCQVQGFGVQHLGVVSVWTILGLAVYQFHVIVREQPAPRPSTIQLFILAIWVVNSVLAMLPILFGSRTHYVLQVSRLYCGFDVLTQEPLSVSFRTLNTAGSFFVPAVIGVLYYFTYRRVAMLSRRVQGRMDPPSPARGKGRGARRQSAPKIDVTLQMRIAVVRRAVSVTLCCLACWSLFGACLSYQLVTGRSVPPVVEGISLILTATNTIGNPVLFFTQDLRYQRSLKRLMGKSQSSDDEYDGSDKENSHSTDPTGSTGKSPSHHSLSLRGDQDSVQVNARSSATLGITVAAAVDSIDYSDDDDFVYHMHHK
ncbi:hypothetical protein BC831DRAFT_472869 [Entophlyctis helioformis]|nr:hypothetical protein BC831DRAFT_472869 [Entophlyctis helioformis]